ncbi:N-acetyltransferase [Pseudonocardiaceae bacterium YIM PH 21723]|nr:N-acetyltransferase [Pseudonocardiaceae bacterium YIM PH 21723]
MTVTLRPMTEADVERLITEDRRAVQTGDASSGGFRNTVRLRAQFAENGFLTPEISRLTVLADGEPVGMVSWRSEQSAIDIGIRLWPEHRGRGHGTEAQRLLVEYLFAVTPVHRVQAGTLDDNFAEQRALEKAGFRRDGVIRGSWFVQGRWRDCVIYSRLRTDAETAADG